MSHALTRRDLFWLASAALPLKAQDAIPYSRRAAVSLVHGGERRKNVTAALEAVDDQILPALKLKKYVLIKPNFVSSQIQLAATHADAVRGILDYLDRFKGPVVIGEASHGDTLEGFEVFGYNRLPGEYRRRKVTLVDLNAEDNIQPLVIMDRNQLARQIRAAGRLFDPDAFAICAAMPKTHDGAVATLSVKNMCMGAPLHSTAAAAARWDHKSACHAGSDRGLHFNILLTAQRMRPFWGATVIDGFEGMENEGPLHGTPVPSRLAIASTDYLAADRVGLEIMGVNPAWPAYLNYCSQAGLGQFDLARIDLRGGVSVETVRKTYKLGPNIDRQLEWMKPLGGRGL